MPIIDADAHVIENESAWDYMLESERRFRPRIVGATNGDPAVDYWFIDGRLIPRSECGEDPTGSSPEHERLEYPNQAYG